QQDLSQGRLSGITLFSRENLSDHFDENPDLRPVESTLKVVATGSPYGNATIRLVKRALQIGKARGWPNARINYVDREGESKKLVLDIDEADALDAYVAKASRIEVDRDIGQCEPEIRQDILLKMEALLDRDTAPRTR